MVITPRPFAKDFWGFVFGVIGKDHFVHEVFAGVLHQLLTMTVVDRLTGLSRIGLVAVEAGEQVFLFVKGLAQICSVHLGKHRVNHGLDLSLESAAVLARILVELLF